jgi:hypothetical protein
VRREPTRLAPVFVDAELSYAILFGRDSERLKNGVGGVFSLGYSVRDDLGAGLEVHYATFDLRGVLPGHVALLVVGAGARWHLPLGRVAFTAGGSLGYAAFGLRSLGEKSALALHARIQIDLLLARNFIGTVGFAPGLVAGRLAESDASLYLPLRLGLAIRF